MNDLPWRPDLQYGIPQSQVDRIESTNAIKIHNMPAEDIIGKFEDNEFDIVFTMAVLEHIHTDSEWIFTEMARITKTHLITIEDERGISWRHFPRDYKKVFEQLGLVQIEEIDCSKIDRLGDGVYARVFQKTSRD